MSERVSTHLSLVSIWYTHFSMTYYRVAVITTIEEESVVDVVHPEVAVVDVVDIIITNKKSPRRNLS